MIHGQLVWPKKPIELFRLPPPYSVTEFCMQIGYVRTIFAPQSLSDLTSATVLWKWGEFASLRIFGYKSLVYPWGTPHNSDDRAEQDPLYHTDNFLFIYWNVPDCEHLCSQDTCINGINFTKIEHGNRPYGATKFANFAIFRGFVPQTPKYGPTNTKFATA